MFRRHVFFGAAVGIQLILLAAIPMQKVPALASGTEIRLRIAPYDPYTVLSGYYANLTYDIGNQANFPPAVRPVENGRTLYVTLRPGADGVWTVAGFALDEPAHAATEEVVIRGTKTRGRIQYGIESYFVPEDKRQEVNAALRANQDAAFADVRVSADGSAAVIRLHLGDKTFEY